MVFFYVETKGPTLEEIAKIFDGDDAEVAFVNVEKDGQAYLTEKQRDFTVGSFRY